MAVKSFVAFDKLTADEMNALLSTKTTRNYVYNGAMDIYQRGSVSSTAAYTLDRWYGVASSGSFTITQDTTTVLSPNGRYSAKITAGATSTMNFQQALETADVYHLAGKTVTLSAYIASSGPTSNLNMVLEYSTTVDNAVTGTWTTIATATSQALTTSLTLIQASYDVPITAKSLRINFYNASTFTSGQSYFVTNVQLEQGNFVSPFNRMGKTVADELQLCQKYFVRIAPTNLSPIAYGWAFSTTEVRVGFSLSIPMRIAPTLTSSANPTLQGTGAGTFSSYVSTSLTQAGSMAYLRITTTGSTAGAVAILQNATSATYDLSAEL
jgi:hypothetical protein